MSNQTFDQDFWEQMWVTAIREHGDKVAGRLPNVHLITDVAEIVPGRALDAGCGHGVDTHWLAAHGWQVTAVDFSETALSYGQAMASAAGAGLADRIEWVLGDLGTWPIEPEHYDLVICLYVHYAHVADSVPNMVRRMASGVAPGGTLLLVGHRPIDPATGAPTPAANQIQVSVEEAVAALDPIEWEFVVAEERLRAIAGTGVDAVIFARRRKG